MATLLDDRVARSQVTGQERALSTEGSVDANCTALELVYWGALQIAEHSTSIYWTCSVTLRSIAASGTTQNLLFGRIGVLPSAERACTRLYCGSCTPREESVPPGQAVSFFLILGCSHSTI